VLLLLINSTIGFVEESAAAKAVKALQDGLAPSAKVKRGGGEWMEVPAHALVPGDLVAVGYIHFRLSDLPEDLPAKEPNLDQKVSLLTSMSLSHTIRPPTGRSAGFHTLEKRAHNLKCNGL
jgi:hypothetical protein